MITALITGIGGTNSIAILKALNRSSLEHRSIGTDIKPLNAGSILADVSYLIPRVSDGEVYHRALESIIRENKVDIIFATTEVEIMYLAEIKEKLEEMTGVVVMVPEKRVLDICQDKYRTQEFLKDSGFTSIPTIIAKSVEDMLQFAEEFGYPIIRKPVQGYGSRGISIVTNRQELETLEIDDEYVLQGYIQGETEEGFDEFTAEVFVNKDSSVAGGIIIQRALIRGESNNGRVVRDDDTLEYLKTIAKALGIKGPCNFQYRKKDGRAYIFEINARYSGTSAVRAHFGFNNVELALQSFIKNNHMKIENSSIGEGYFVRYWEEAYIDAQAFEGFSKTGGLSSE